MLTGDAGGGGRKRKAGAVCRARALVGDQTMMTAVSTAGSKAQGVSFKEAGVAPGGKVGVRKRLLLLERPQRKQGYPGQVVVCCDLTEFINRLSRFLESMATVGVG